MPIYEYECPVCKVGKEKKPLRFHAYRRMEDFCKPGSCPECGRQCNKIMSGMNFVMGKREELYQGPRRRAEKLL